MCYENKIKEDGDSRNNFFIRFFRIYVLKKLDYWLFYFNLVLLLCINFFIIV